MVFIQNLIGTMKLQESIHSKQYTNIDQQKRINKMAMVSIVIIIYYFPSSPNPKSRYTFGTRNPSELI